MWCDTEKFSEDTLLLTPRSDSGITSPHSHNNIDLLDHIPNEELRRRLSLFYKKPNLEEEEKQCLQQVLNLIQNLDSMSNESISSEEPISLEIVKSRTTELDSSHQSLPTHRKASKSCSNNNNHRIVATISPYTTTSFTSQSSSPSDTPKRLRNWQTTSLSESGVFEGDSFENFSQSTQTEAEDLLEIFSTSHASRDLCAEIQKLTKFREEIEESSSVPSSSVIDLQKRLHYYKDRVEVLESKLIIYESSGDLQTKRLADRLQREVQLEYSVKELSDRVDILKLENSILEEEKCEFEEAENDTRLKLQRLEVDLEILSQRNIELEVSREAFQQKLDETKQLNLEFQQEFQKSQDRVELLENDSKELLEALNLLRNRLSLSDINMDTCGNDNQNLKNTGESCQHDSNGDQSSNGNDSKIIKLQSEVHNLREREQKLICEIKNIQLHYREVMENADHHWKQLETNLTSQLAEACSNEACLKTKILQLEKRLFCDSSAAQEKISFLEESEDELKKCLNKLTRDNRRLNEDYCSLNEELTQCREEFKKTNQTDGKCLDQEKSRNKELSDEIEYLKKSLAESECAGRQELQCLKHELCRVKKELLQIEVTNAELREEVCTLENTISDLQRKCKNDTDKIRCLGDELRDRDDLCDQMERKLNRCTCDSKSKGPKSCNKVNQNICSGEEISLAQELGEEKCPSKKLKREEVKDLKQASNILGQALTQIEECSKCLPKNCHFHCVAADVKKLAETFLGGNLEDTKTECLDENIKPEICPCCHAQRDVADFPDSCQNDKTAVENNIDKEKIISIQDNQEASPTGDITVAMAYEIQTNNPFFSITSHFQSLKKMLNFGKPTGKDNILTTEEIAKTPLPKYRRKQFARKFRQRHCLTPSLQSRIRRILTSNKFHQLDQNVSDDGDTEEFHSAKMGSFYQNLTSTKAEIHSIEESREVFNFNDLYSKSLQSLNSSNIEYEIVSDFNLLDDKIIQESVPTNLIDSQVLNQDFDTSPENIFASRGYQLKKTFSDLDILVLILRQACEFYEEPTTERDSESLFIQIMKENMKNSTNFNNAISCISKCGQDLIDPRVTSSNYEEFEKNLSFIKMIVNSCSEIHIPILTKLENQIAEKILQYQSDNVDNDYCCAVYYPVLR